LLAIGLGSAAQITQCSTAFIFLLCLPTDRLTKKIKSSGGRNNLSYLLRTREHATWPRQTRSLIVRLLPGQILCKRIDVTPESLKLPGHTTRSKVDMAALDI
jgi:hypothetical protein